MSEPSVPEPVVSAPQPASTRIDRRERRRHRIASAKASREVPGPLLDPQAPPVVTVWRTRSLPAPITGRQGVPFIEGVTSVFAGSLLYIPVALVTKYSAWNYLVATVLVLLLSYALCSRQVVIGTEFLAVRKLGPYRLASAASIVQGALLPSQRGGVLKIHTGDGRTMRLRRIEFTQPEMNAQLRKLLLGIDKPYDAGVMQLLDLPWRAEFGHQRYLLDAIQ